jgi:hypothetical protein
MTSRRSSQSRICACGCDEATKGGEFRPGHDAKLRGQFLKRIDDGEERAIEEFITERPNLVFPYGYTEASLRARLGGGK